MRLALVCFLLVVVLNFFLPRLLPGNPVAYLTGFSEQDVTPAQVAFYEDALHLNKPLAAQFGYYLRSLLDGTLGYSYKKDAAVSALIGEENRLYAANYGPGGTAFGGDRPFLGTSVRV